MGRVHQMRIPASLVACVVAASLAIFSSVWTRVIGVHSTRHVRSFSLGGGLEISLTTGVHLCLLAVAVGTLHVVEATTARCQRAAAAELRLHAGADWSAKKPKKE